MKISLFGLFVIIFFIVSLLSLVFTLGYYIGFNKANGYFKICSNNYWKVSKYYHECESSFWKLSNLTEYYQLENDDLNMQINNFIDECK